MSKQNHLYLVDGSSYIFRAYHRLPPLTNQHGQPVGAVYGYTTMLWKLADALDKADGPTHLAVILDKSSTSFRNALFDQYKAHRPPPPEDLVPQFPMIRDATRAFSLPCIEEDDYEADDIIACYTKAALRESWHVTIVSSDKDLMQLIEEPSPSGGGGVDMLDTMKNVRMGRDAVIEKFGVGPERLGDVLALMGDSVDNVPGVPGIGPKTASKLITEFGDLDGVLAAAPAMKPSKMRDNLIEHEPMARLSRRLVELECNMALPQPLDEMALNGIPPAPLREFLAYHGFKSLLAKVDSDGRPSAHGPASREFALAIASDGNAPPPKPASVPRPHQPIDRATYETVMTLDALDQWIEEATRLGTVAIDTETDCLDCVTGKLVGFSMATAPARACYVPLQHGGTDLLAERPDQIPLADAVARLAPLLADDSVRKVGHNIKYDISVLAQHGLEIRNFDDTILMSFALDGGAGNHGMDELAQKHLDHACIAFKHVCGTGLKQISFAEVPLPQATEYAAEDADVTYRLWQMFSLRLAPEGGTRIYQMVDRPLVPALAAMERRGVIVDKAQLAKLSGGFATEIRALESAIYEDAGGPFTIGSPKQLGEVLFDRLGLKGGRKGKSGVWSTDVTELERLRKDGVPIAAKLSDWRQLSKLKSTYTDALQQQINAATGRVHTSYSLTGAQTGRLSSTDPNLQNIPIRTEVGRQIRDAFVAAPGNVILAADYSQIELRLAAHMADVPELREAFARGDDIHSITALQLFGEVNRDTRGKAKTINFAILYGISRWGLAQRLEITPDEAQAMISTYFQRFPGISNYINETLEFARANGFTETLFGRKTHFPRIRSANQTERQGSERAAINAPIQGTSADIIKRAMARMDAALTEAGLGQVRMLLQVHDELVFELPETQVDSARPIIEHVMATAAQPAIKLSVPLGIEIGTGTSWGAAH